MNRELPRNLAQGQAGVYRVASELLLRGFPVNFPAVDCGADLTTSSGVRIQVKSAHLGSRKIRDMEISAYFFKLGTRAIVRNRHITHVRRVFTDECEFVVLWGIEHNRFWIVPAQVLDNHSLVAIDLDEQWLKVDIATITEARESGLSYRDIEKKLGTSRDTVRRRLNISTVPRRGTLVQAVRETENRWDLISSHLALLEGSPASPEEECPTEISASKETMNTHGS